ncbi:MAG: TlpA disulfide reductase family protein [Acidobacteriota bacterium]
MRFLAVSLILILSAAALGQSGRANQAPAPSQSGTPPNAEPAPTVKQMFGEANDYIRTKAAEYDAKKVPFSDRLFAQTKLEQRSLAAKYASVAGARTDLAGDDFYYFGMLHWIAENLDGASEALRMFVAIDNADAAHRQTARSILVVISAKQNKLEDAEKLLADYLKTEPTKLTERARMEGELAKAYQAQKDFIRMAPHAEADYDASKLLLKDPSSRVRGLDEILDAGMLVFEAWRDGGNQKKADGSLDDMAVIAASVSSSTFYYYAIDQKIKYMIETGRKPQAMSFYAATIANGGKALSDKDAQTEVTTRLRKREKHYKLLGEPAPELPIADQWFPGERKTFADLKGKVVLLDFWATWCGPCFDAFPSLIEWQQDFGRDGLEILGVTRYYGAENGLPADNPSELIYMKSFRERHSLPYDFVVAKDQSMQLLYGATALPTAILIDRKGVIRYIEPGTSSTRLEQMREMIVKLLAEK